MEKQETKPVVEVYTLEALARMFDQIAPATVHGDKFKASHSCAAALHGWNLHEYNFGELSLSVTDYVEALKAAGLGKVHSPANRRKPRK